MAGKLDVMKAVHSAGAKAEKLEGWMAERMADLKVVGKASRMAGMKA